jgi:hypothetical protein
MGKNNPFVKTSKYDAFGFITSQKPSYSVCLKNNLSSPPKDVPIKRP